MGCLRMFAASWAYCVHHILGKVPCDLTRQDAIVLTYYKKEGKCLSWNCSVSVLQQTVHFLPLYKSFAEGFGMGFRKPAVISLNMLEEQALYCY